MKYRLTLLIILVMVSFAFLNDQDKKNIYNLGRDNDPKLISDIKPFKLWTKKTTWSILSTPGMRFMIDLIFPKSSIAYLKTDKKVVAFTIDDGFCGLDNPGGDMTAEVRELFKKYSATATFFVTGSHCAHTKKDDVLALLNDGHELANHSMYDMPYNKMSLEDFEMDFEQTHKILSEYTDNIPKWYRAPHAKLSKTMQSVIDTKDYTHVVCDAFASDTSIPDAKWISKFILKKVKPGSIVLIHMPEKGIREWNFEAMELTLKGLKEEGYDIVTFSELYELSQ